MRISGRCPSTQTGDGRARRGRARFRALWPQKGSGGESSPQSAETEVVKQKARRIMLRIPAVASFQGGCPKSTWPSGAKRTEMKVCLHSACTVSQTVNRCVAT